MYVLQKFPHHDIVFNTPVEPMHLVHILGGNQDSVKVRLEDKARKRFKSSWPTESLLPAAPFSISKENFGYQIADQIVFMLHICLTGGDEIFLAVVEWGFL